MNINNLQNISESLFDNPEYKKWIFGESQNNGLEEIEFNHEFEENAYIIKEIIQSFRNTNDILNEDDIHSIWKNINNFYFKKHKRIKLQKIFFWASLVFAILIFYGFSYFYSRNSNNNFKFTVELINNDNEAKLFLDSYHVVKLTNKKEKPFILNAKVTTRKLKNTDSVNKQSMNENNIICGLRINSFLGSNIITWIKSDNINMFQKNYLKGTYI